MSQWPVRLILLAATTGILLPYCFPRYDLGLLAWVALIPLHIALAGLSRRRQAFWLGWLAGIICSTGIMSWVVTAMHTYGKVPLIFSYGIMLLLTAYLGLYVGIYSAGVVWFRMLIPRYGLFAAPCLWVTLELLRTYVLSGLPWSLLGYSQYRQLDVIQIADHLGVYGVSFLIVLTNVALAELYLWLMPLFRGFRPARLPWELVTTAAMLVGLSWAYSTSLIASEGMEGSKATLQVGVVQPNIDQAVKWDQAFREETLRRYDRLTESFGYGVDLVVWPEAATPFIYEREPVYQLQLVAMANRASAPLLFGSPAVRFDPERKPFLLNSAYLLSPDGELLGRYDKQHLVPFGEYIPLKSSLLFFLEKMVEGIGDFQAGPGPTILSFQLKESQGAAPARRVKFGVVICYEVIFPDLVRRFASSGAEFLVTITNDAWFGDSSAPTQHFSMVVFRSVENHLAFARAANTGISGFIDPFGRIIVASPTFTQTALQAEIPVRQTKTFYSRHGDVFAYGCMLISLLFCLYGIFGTKGAEPDAVAATPV
ncbi:MAG TPA: apolipoprotein N-acyltransferase [Nitrospira sp.]|nr:apolipoprotein N-acyltransferase [Nitrospira sp.]